MPEFFGLQQVGRNRATAVGLAALMSVWGLALWSAFRFHGAHRSLKLGLVLSLSSLFALHFVYGDDHFLYSGTWTFFVVALIASCLAPAIEKTPKLRAIVVILVVIQCVNNVEFMRFLISVYAMPGRAGLPG